MQQQTIIYKWYARCVVTCDARAIYVRVIRKRRFCSFQCTFLSQPRAPKRDDIFSPYVKPAHRPSAHGSRFHGERDFPRFRIAQYMHVYRGDDRPRLRPRRISRPIHDQLHRLDWHRQFLIYVYLGHIYTSEFLKFFKLLSCFCYDKIGFFDEKNATFA